MDFQNDFVASEQGTSMGQIAVNIQRVVSFARAHNTEVIWVRFVGDEVHQSQPWRHRNRSQQRTDWCIEGTWGAEIFSAVAPAAGERVFDKKAHFDPFLNSEFNEYMADKGYEHLVLVGLYSDICVDATARTAFQKGLWTTIVRDCTAPKHLREKDVLLYMIRVYGTRVVTCDELLKMEA
jgi:nicotinamidase-related amidase